MSREYPFPTFGSFVKFMAQCATMLGSLMLLAVWGIIWMDRHIERQTHKEWIQVNPEYSTMTYETFHLLNQRRLLPGQGSSTYYKHNR